MKINVICCVSDTDVPSDTDHPSGENLKNFNQPVTESVTARETDTEELLVMNVSTVTRTIGTQNKGVGRNRYEWHTCIYRMLHSGVSESSKSIT